MIVLKLGIKSITDLDARFVGKILMYIKGDYSLACPLQQSSMSGTFKYKKQKYLSTSIPNPMMPFPLLVRPYSSPLYSSALYQTIYPSSLHFIECQTYR